MSFLNELNNAVQNKAETVAAKCYDNLKQAMLKMASDGYTKILLDSRIYPELYVAEPLRSATIEALRHLLLEDGLYLDSYYSMKLNESAAFCVRWGEEQKKPKTLLFLATSANSFYTSHDFYTLLKHLTKDDDMDGKCFSTLQIVEGDTNIFGFVPHTLAEIPGFTDELKAELSIYAVNNAYSPKLNFEVQVKIEHLGR